MPIVRVRTKFVGNNVVSVFAVTLANLDKAENADTTLVKGQIEKRGSAEHSQFLSRWVTVTPSHISYAKFENTRVIDRIDFNEVSALCILICVRV